MYLSTKLCILFSTFIHSFPFHFHCIQQEAKETLCDPEKRANYDKWRNSGIAMSYKNWLGMKEHVGQVRRYTIAEKVDKEVWEQIQTTIVLYTSQLGMHCNNTILYTFPQNTFTILFHATKHTHTHPNALTVNECFPFDVSILLMFL